MKKLIAIALAVVMCLALVAMVACNSNNDKTTNQLTPKDFYAYGAVSIGSMIDMVNGGTGTQSVAKMTTESTTQTAQGTQQNANGNNSGSNSDLSTGLTDEQMATVNELMALVESLIDESKIDSQVTESDREGYKYKSVVSFTDMLGEKVSYTLYYNETEIINNGNTTRDRDDDDNEKVQRYDIDGIMIIDEIEYAIQGKSVTKSEEDMFEQETSREMTFVAYTSEDKTSYIRVNQEVESETEGNGTENEAEIVYSVYQNSKMVQQTIIEREQENNENELTMIVTKNGERSVIDFSDETKNNGMRIIDVKATLNGESVHFKIFITKNEQGEDVYRYQFKDGYKDCDRDFWDD